MAGIFRGATPVGTINIGNTPVRSVWLGSTKIWPSAPWLTFHGSWSGAGFSNPVGTTSWRTNPSVNVISSPTPNSTLIDWGVLSPLRTLRGLFVNSSQNSGLTTLRISANGSIISTSPARSHSAQYSDANRAAWFAGHRALCGEVNQGDTYYEAYARFNSTGVLTGADSPGWSCVRAALGVYNVTAPRSFNGTVFTIMQNTVNLFGTINNQNGPAGTFTVSVVNMSNARIDAGFCVMITGDL